MYFVYILKSIRFDRYYIGSTNNLAFRLRDHNEGRVRSTKHYSPFTIRLFEEYSTRSEAVCREHELKRMKRGNSFKNLLRDRLMVGHRPLKP
ncbi:MAG TPA: GIY-YIG nuclease family protein [Candidatus Dojkabacteria bacterium]|nr:GIY-YIG nuclease family protein [Candidatus Dojkabacteria bacterium]HQG57954.1 GIY-YIG nuclease family protein [Candidatus Dojkabacteria bacterium]